MSEDPYHFGHGKIHWNGGQHSNGIGRHGLLRSTRLDCCNYFLFGTLDVVVVVLFDLFHFLNDASNVDVGQHVFQHMVVDHQFFQQSLLA